MKVQVNTETIKNYLRENRLTKEEFCLNAGISTSRFRTMLEQKEPASLTYIIRLSRLMNINLYSLVF